MRPLATSLMVTCASARSSPWSIRVSGQFISVHQLRGSARSIRGFACKEKALKSAMRRKNCFMFRVVQYSSKLFNIVKKNSASISRVLCHARWCLSLILSSVLLRPSVASYPPVCASSAQTLVYLELQPIVCSYHFLYSVDN